MADEAGLDELPTSCLDYALQEGWVRDWLVLGPVTAVNDKGGADLAALLAAWRAGEHGIAQTPAERAPCALSLPDGTQANLLWRVVNTLEDRCVDLAATRDGPRWVAGWGYAQVVLPTETATRLRVVVVGHPTAALAVWINGELRLCQDTGQGTGRDTGRDTAHDGSLLLTLGAGTTEVLVAVAAQGVGALPLAWAAQLMDVAEATVRLPTTLEPPARRQKLADVMAHAYLTQSVFSRDQRIVLHWPADFAQVDVLAARLQTPANRIYAEARPMIQAGRKVDFGQAKQYPDGLYEILLQPEADEYYVREMRVQRRIPLWIANGEWSAVYHGDGASRRQDALTALAARGGVTGEIAKAELGQWAKVQRKAVEDALEREGRADLLALLAWRLRRGDEPEFPAQLAWAIEQAAVAQLGGVASTDAGGEWLTAACALLAGQSYPGREFGARGAGAQVAAQAAAALRAWMTAALQCGLPDGESEQALADALTVCAYVVEWAQADDVAELAAALLDKLAFVIALQTQQGVWGGSQDGATPTAWLGRPRLGALSGVGRLWWGQGCFTTAGAATLALACAESYALPEIIAAAAVDRRAPVVVRRADLAQGRPVNRVAYATADYLLTSLQVTQAAAPRGLLWQAAVGPDAAVIGNRPGALSEHDAWPTNLWQGSVGAVTAGQWRDTLAVIYHAGDLPDWAFTHARLEVGVWDEVRFAQGWVMARKGNGYVALTATGGLRLVTQGPTAQREARAAAACVWLCQMGRAAEDGLFSHFVEKVLAAELTLRADAVRFGGLRGESFALDADGTLRINGQPTPRAGFPHVESPFGGAAELPAAALDISYQGNTMRLALGDVAPQPPVNQEMMP